MFKIFLDFLLQGNKLSVNAFNFKCDAFFKKNIISHFFFQSHVDNDDDVPHHDVHTLSV